MKSMTNASRINTNFIACRLTSSIETLLIADATNTFTPSGGVRKPTRAIKLPKPTTLRLLRILQDTGFVSREPFTPGSACITSLRDPRRPHDEYLHKLSDDLAADAILLLVTAKGGVASASMLREMKERGAATKAIIFLTKGR
jgi:hypothetical protein